MPKFMYADAKARVVCPRCKAELNAQCRQPSGEKRTVPHGERLIALTNLPLFNREDYAIDNSKTRIGKFLK